VEEAMNIWMAVSCVLVAALLVITALLALAERRQDRRTYRAWHRAWTDGTLLSWLDERGNPRYRPTHGQVDITDDRSTE
jgi:hypothetical protein